MLLQDPRVDPSAESSACTNGYKEVVEILLKGDRIELDLPNAVGYTKKRRDNDLVEKLQNTKRQRNT
jgi:hypothetical protein